MYEYLFLMMMYVVSWSHQVSWRWWTARTERCTCPRCSQ